MMAGPTILDADMATVGRWARDGFDWWLAELRGMVPAQGLGWTRRGPALTAHFDGLNLVLTRRGVAVARPRGRPAVALAVPGEAVLVREAVLPMLAPADLARLIAFDADRLLPFAPGTALVAHEAGRPRGDGTQGVAVAALRLEAASAAMAAAGAQGYEVRRLGAGGGTGGGAGGGVRFDFLPAWRRAGAEAKPTGARFWWGLVAALFAGNLGVWIGRDVVNLRETAALVEAHGQTAGIARTLRARVIAEDGRRRRLLADRAGQDPLPILAAFTRALPDGAWVQRLAWDGAQARAAGYAAGEIDVVRLLRASPYFVAVRSTAVDVPAQAAVQPFEVTADTGRVAAVAAPGAAGVAPGAVGAATDLGGARP